MYIYIYISICVYMYMYMYGYVCMCVYIYIYTHTHIFISHIADLSSGLSYYVLLPLLDHMFLPTEFHACFRQLIRPEVIRVSYACHYVS